MHETQQEYWRNWDFYENRDQNPPTDNCKFSGQQWEGNIGK